MGAHAAVPRDIDVFALRSCLARFGTGVAVVALDHPAGRAGLTVNSFTAVSLDPPLVLVAILKSARSHDLFPGRPFSVNVLGAEQEAVARHFAGLPHPDHVRFETGEVAPRLAGALATFECLPWRDYDGGDHTLYLGEVVGFDYRDGDALGYLYSRFATLEQPRFGIEHIFG
jgi:flavin reductase (DIM6/NTAB) family NADH-FMN oxidoreductase RutF